MQHWTALGIATQIRKKQLSPVEVLQSYARCIEAHNPKLNAFITLALDQARQQAQQAEQAVTRGEPLGLLHGVPLAIKDLTPTAGIRTTFGSRLFEQHVPEQDAEVVRRIKAQGGIIVGKTTTPEFGSHVVTKGEIFGNTHNPWNLLLTPGGSSGGSAAAVAAGMLPIAHGNDGGGSTRIPASFCGLFGFKPSYGRISNHPAKDYYTSITCSGPLSRTVADGIVFFQAMCGYDPHDPYSLPDQDFLGLLDAEPSVKDLRIAWSADLGYAVVDPQVKDLCTKGAKVFEELGAHLSEAHPGFDDPRPFFNTIIEIHMLAGIAEHLERRHLFETMLAGLVKEVENVRPIDLAQSQVLRGKLLQQCVRFFEHYDLLLTPTMGALPPAVDADLGPDQRIEGQYFTHPFNLTHLPAANVPVGWTAEGLPVGLQIVGGPRADALVLKAALAFEGARPWAHRWPSL